MVEFGIGQPVPRKEDLRLLTGGGRYVPDIALPDMAFAAMVRSPHAHARIEAIDTTTARASPGVIAVFTRADFDADGRRPIPHQATVSGAPDVDAARAARLDRVHGGHRDARRRQGALRRRTGRDGGRGLACRGEGRGGTCRHRLPGASRRGARRRCAEGRGAAGVGRVRREPQRRWRGRRSGGNRRGVRACGARGAAGDLDPPRHRRADGATHRDRRLRRGDRALHHPCRHRRPAWCASDRPSPTSSASPRSSAARCAATWAATSARATASFRNTACCRGRRNASAGR